MDRTVREVAVVEDDDDLRELYAQYLESGGFVVIQAADGAQALPQIKRVRPVAVVLDLFMPRLGGLEALRWIKAFDPAIRVVVVTGRPEAALHQAALAAGASSILKKPVGPEALLAALSEALSDSGAADSRPMKPIEPSTSLAGTGRVLIVDDEADVRALLTDVLAVQGYRLRAVNDGAEALRYVIDEPPDVVLMDIDMPRLGGVEALTAIQAVAPDVKVIMISGKASEDTAKLSLAYGAFDYVTKPFDLNHLSDVIRAALLWSLSTD